MDRYRPPLIAAAVLLAALAGFVDALAYLDLGGFFASFMSGNTTRLGVGIATADHASAKTAGALICAFICGVMIATMLSMRFARRRKPVVMLAVAVLLGLAALVTGQGAAVVVAAISATIGVPALILARDLLRAPAAGREQALAGLVNGSRPADAAAAGNVNRA